MTREIKKGLPRLIAASKNSYSGLVAAWKGEEAFRQECILFGFALPLSVIVGDSLVEVIILVSVVALLLIVELLNTAVESTVDRIGLENHALSGQAKDQGSAAVLIASCLAAFVWIAVLAS